MKNITIVGAGYVGMALAALLSQKNNINILETDNSKVDLINNNKSPIKDDDIEKFLLNNVNTLVSTTNTKKAFINADYIFIALPTNFDEKTSNFDTSIIEELISKALKVNPSAVIVIKSTVPIGFTEAIKEKFKTNNIIFSPEFLREGKALHDNYFPSRVIIGTNDLIGHKIALLLTESAKKKQIDLLFMNSSEAEAVKLFSNSFLAMRVSFFNELDSFALDKNLSTQKIIEGVSLDNRIGDYYNNPSFGYGGYCLPKDTKQLLSSFEKVPQTVIESIVTSNETRKYYIATHISSLNPGLIGIFKLSMKKNSDNTRSSALEDIMKILLEMGNEIILYEPSIEFVEHRNCEVINDLNLFKIKSKIILANRLDQDIEDVQSKVFTRDVFGND